MSRTLRRTIAGAALILALCVASPGTGGDVQRVTNCYPNLVPEVAFVRLEYSASYVDIWLSITNWASFPPEFFIPAPHLPPCGLNLSSPRMWVSAFGRSPSGPMGGYCGVGDPEFMQEIRFGTYPSLCPAAVEVLFEDRECGITYRSAPIPIPCQTAIAPASWTLVKCLYRD